jgi:hypothetical protein
LAAQPSADLDPSHSGISNGLRPAARNTALRNVRELRSCAGQPARRCLPLRGPSKTARRSGNRPALCRRLGVRPGQHRRERLGDLLVAGVVGMQTVGPTNQIPRTNRSWSLPREGREARDLNLPVEPGVREGRDALVRWAVLLEEVIP